MKKLNTLSYLLLGVLFAYIDLSSPIPVNAYTHNSEAIIQDMVTAIQEKNWSAFIDLMSSDEQAFFIQYFDNAGHNNGIKQIESVSLESVIHVNDKVAELDLLTEEYPILERSKHVQTFLVGLNCRVNKENQYFYNGLNYVLIALARDDDGEMRIAQFNRPSYDVTVQTIESDINENDINYEDKVAAFNVIKKASLGYLVNAEDEAITDCFTVVHEKQNADTEPVKNPFSYNDTPNLGAYTSYSTPDTILVKMNKDGDGAVVEYSFDYYVKNTIANEWMASWNTHSLKAGAYCIKGVGWYRIIKPVSSAGGYDVTQGTQYFRVESSTATTDAVFDSIKNSYMVNSSNSIFFPEYGAGPVGDTGTAGSGRLLQNGSQTLAKNGKTYTEILNYYYKGSNYSSGTLKYITKK